MRLSCLPALTLLALSFFWTAATSGFAQFTFTEINDPSAVNSFGNGSTYAFGISGSNVVGYFVDPTTDYHHGFFYDGSTYTTLDDPLGYSTAAVGISGQEIVGNYQPTGGGNGAGFLYSGGVYQTIRDPNASSYTDANAISGNNIVGDFGSNGTQYGFFYNGTTYATLKDPLAGAGGTSATGIDGNDVVGTYIDSNGVSHGYLFNGSTYTTIDDPLAANNSATNGNFSGTELGGISGDNIVGMFADANNVLHGFLYNGSSYTVMDDPASIPQGVRALTDVDGNSAVGFYLNQTGWHGFEVTAVPEPSNLLLLSFTLLGFGFYRFFMGKKLKPLAEK